MFFEWLVLGKGEVDDVGCELADSSDNAVSVAVAHWNIEHRVFAVQQIFRNSDSVVTVQRLFCRKFNVVRRGAFPDPYIIHLCVEAFRSDHARSKSSNLPFVKKLQHCHKKCWSMRCRTLRRGSECVSGKKDVI